ncbi:hypothetical protein Micbo1qcDRAFT_208403 [Microdochium bolleyi]|uniref:Uncharacterized protein n=1 Tax=Microdochium bolleyi TaxID=196109 RepID=A0A136IQ01_9PEZI|nr:hypothetical protein Micbo1qcDRAFT_208403 [Microdochium bolleyi]
MTQYGPQPSDQLLPNIEYSQSLSPPPGAAREHVVSTIPNNIEREILQQLQVLVHIQHQAAQRRPIAAETIYNGVLQLLAFCLAITFGVFAITSWQAALAANGFAATANSLASTANEFASTANDLSRKAGSQADDADIVAAQANCMAAGVLALSLVELCERQTMANATNSAFAFGCRRINLYTSRRGNATSSELKFLLQRPCRNLDHAIPNAESHAKHLV